MKLDLQFECENEDGDPVIIALTVSYKPGSRAPRCSNPESGLFYEIGDAPDVRILWATFPETHLEPSQSFLDSDYLQDLLHLKAREAYEAL